MQGRGTVVTGRVEAGTIKVGDEIEVLGLASGGVPRKSVVTGVEMFHRSMTQGQAGDNVGLLLRGIRKGDVERGQVQSLLLTILFSCNSFLLTGMLLVCRRKAGAQTKKIAWWPVVMQSAGLQARACYCEATGRTIVIL